LFLSLTPLRTHCQDKHLLLHTPQSVVLFWTRDRPVAENSTCQHTTLTTDRYPCPLRDSNPHSQHARGPRHTT